ncbi:Lipoprotein YhcN precursor [compost metagenome]
MNKLGSSSVKWLLIGSSLLVPLVACSANRNQNIHQQSMSQAPMATLHPNSAATNTEQKYRVADQAANQLATMPEIHQANVLVVGRTSYVAAALKKNQTYSPELESKISQQVKSVDPQIDQVYVSVNPDFVSRVNTYVSDVRNGRPVSGLVTELGEMVRRLFPHAH